MSLNGILFGMGNPLLDISTVVPLSLLEKYNLKANDAILADEKHMPLYKELMDNYKCEYTPGGATQNSIKIAQWILKEKDICVFAGCVKDDHYGKILNDSCTEIGVKTAYEYNKGPESTGLCACLIINNDRSLVTNLGASCKFTIDHLNKPEYWSLVEQAKFFYISAFFINSCQEALLKVAHHSLIANKTFCFNLSAMFLVEFFYDQLEQALVYSDIIFGSEIEAMKLAEKAQFQTTDMKEVALKISQMPYKRTDQLRTVIITQGCDPVIVAYQGEILEFPIIKVPKDKIVDTIGAGDSFVGGFLAHLVRGKPLKECVEFGIKLGALIIQRSGCTFPKEVPNDLC